MKSIGLILVIFLMSFPQRGFSQEALRAFFDAKKAEYLQQFVAPQTGDQLELRLNSGQCRIGTLYGLSNDRVTLITDRGEIVYKRDRLDLSSRTMLFAEDYAHAKAYEQTRLYKQNSLAEAAKPSHAANLMVRADLTRDSEKEILTYGDEERIIGQIQRKSQQYDLDVSVSNTLDKEQTFEVCWFVVGRNISFDGEEEVIDSGRRTLSVSAKGREKVELRSKKIVLSEEKKRKRINDRIEEVKTDSGHEVEGYIVLLKAGDSVLDAKSNKRSYLSEDWLQRL